ncbi:cupin domain-containing protein [Arundinibacter roseus]|uniref:Cupin domain-containing protein n=1 Tax=Arundinibacter roseus TaxID=2070510 RepID=A0A4R4KKR4_9BACT|nr:cupin domain-containing protein [Arundinibacter roseus]TDB68867.1 cupin domain-containing protein [Arundinibacter roseus]
MTYPLPSFLNSSDETIELVETTQNQGGQFTTLRRVVRPALVLPQPYLHAHCDEIIDVLYGTLSYTLGGETGQIRAGGRIIFPGGLPHAHGNLSFSEELIYFQMFAPCRSADMPMPEMLTVMDSGKNTGKGFSVGIQKTIIFFFARLSQQLCGRAPAK